MLTDTASIENESLVKYLEGIQITQKMLKAVNKLSEKSSSSSSSNFTSFFYDSQDFQNVSSCAAGHQPTSCISAFNG